MSTEGKICDKKIFQIEVKKTRRCSWECISPPSEV